MAGAEYEAAYPEQYAIALSEPMEWLRLDTDFMRDNKIRRLSVIGGWEAVGKYVAFICCLATCDGHIYDVSTDLGWRFLCADMSNVGCEMGEAEAHEFVSVLASLSLIDGKLFAESKKVASERLLREAEVYAKGVAKGRAHAKVLNRKA
jgi:hypothetical protein